MGTIFKLLSNPAILSIVKALWAFLETEAAAFTAKYLSQAIPIVIAAESQANPDGTAMSGAQKFKWAGSQLSASLILDGKQEEQHAIDTAIQTAVNLCQPFAMVRKPLPAVVTVTPESPATPTPTATDASK